MEKSNYLDNYRWFVEKCYELFSFVVSEHQYELVPASSHGYELTIAYKKWADAEEDPDYNRRGFRIFYEFPGFPVITFFEAVGPKAQKTVKSKEYSFDKFIDKYASSSRTTKVFMEYSDQKHIAREQIEGFGIVQREEVINLLQNYAKVLKNEGRELLEGDFAKLHAIESDEAEIRALKRKKRLV